MRGEEPRRSSCVKIAGEGDHTLSMNSRVWLLLLRCRPERTS